MQKYKKDMLHFLKPYACLIMLEVYISILDKLCFMMISVPLFALFHLCIVQPYFLSTLYTGLFNLYTKYLVIKDFQYEE